jgi:photosystem II stability/assembly factor-like uncharacterized protein
MFRSGDGGDTWKHSNAGLAATQIDVVAVSPASKVFAVGSGHMFQSTDAGVTWSVDQTGPDDAAAIAFDPSDAQTAYAGTFFEGVMKTTDGGAHWNQVDGNHGYSLGIAVEPNDTQSVDAGADVTVRRSVNGGGTWNPTGAIGFQVHQIAFSNEQNPVTLAATSGGVFQSTNDGAVWHQRSDGGTGSVSFDPLHPLIAYAAGFDQPHVMKSVDGGHTWNPSDTGLGPKDYVTTMVVDPAHPTTLYVGTQGAGVFRSTDSGGHWSAFNAGLFNKTVTSLAISSTGTTLFAATTGNGVFVIHLP